MLRADRRRRPALESLEAAQIDRHGRTAALAQQLPGGILAALAAPEPPDGLRPTLHERGADRCWRPAAGFLSQSAAPDGQINEFSVVAEGAERMVIIWRDNDSLFRY